MDWDRYDRVRAIAWQGDCLRLLDQRKLPLREEFLTLHQAPDVAQAIRDLVVRGAPAIGIAAAYGLVLAARAHADAEGRVEAAALADAEASLRASRPTAVNLFWALERMRQVLGESCTVAELEAEAERIAADDLAANRTMGQLGASLIAAGSGVLTHCNTGSLATAGFGTALGVIRAGYAKRLITEVYHTETRPWLQGTRLTAWELLKDGIPARLIADSAAAHLFASGAVQWLIVGADRIAANGDVANKIGTLQLAIVARHFGARVMVVAPWSTVDLATASGDQIPIELRDANELLESNGQRLAAIGVSGWNPVFDVTPAQLIDVLVTERGVIERPSANALRRLQSI